MLTKSHGLGNDYLVADGADLPFTISSARIQLLCDRHAGVGADGLLVRVAETSVRIFNPDGSEAEKSGNGLRIFAKWLFDTRRVQTDRFTITTAGGDASVQIEAEDGLARVVTVDMGVPRWRGDLSRLTVDDQDLDVVALSVGNPHCVVFRARLDVVELRRLGPLIEHHPVFPQRTNVQLARVLDRAHVELLIWERGAGETRASGSSSCAVVAAAQHLDLVDVNADVVAAMPGGELTVRIDSDSHLWLRGPVEEIATFTLSADLIARLHALP